MSQKTLIFTKFILGNLLQTTQALGLVLGLYFLIKLSFSILTILFFCAFWVYVLPPVVLRILYCIGGKPEGRLSPNDKGFWVWYFGAQLQSIYLRFLFFEEFLRTLPFVYSAWLRLWGAEIGKGIYWAPRVYILDRPHIKIGDFVMAGYGVGITSHLFNRVNGEIELILASPQIKENAVLGGLSGLAPGCVVEAGETLPTTMALAPFYVWKNGRRHASI